MPVVPTVPTWAPGIVTTSQLNQVAAMLTFLAKPPAAELRQTVAQSLTTSVWASVTFDVEDYDSANAHDTAVNSSRFTAVYPGWYLVAGQGGFVANATGIRATRWVVNGSVLNSSDSHIGAFATFAGDVPARTKLVYLAIGDYVELQVFQSSGGALNTGVLANEQSGASVKWVSN